MRTATISTDKMREIYTAEYARAFQDYKDEMESACSSLRAADTSKSYKLFADYSRRTAAAERIWSDTSVMIMKRFKDLTGSCLF